MSDQINRLGYQPSNTELAQEEEQNNLLLNLLGGTAATAGVGAGTTAIRAEQRRRDKGGSYKDNFLGAAGDIKNDLIAAQQVVRGKTEFDRLEREAELSPKSEGSGYRSIQEYAQKGSDPIVNLKSTSSYRNNPFTQAAIAARDSFNPSSEDFLSVGRSIRREQGQSAEGPRSQVAISRIPLIDGIRDLLPAGIPGGFTQDEKVQRQLHGISLMKDNAWQAGGGLIGRGASDFVNNGLRSAWWLINAPQAVSDLVSEEFTARANREGLYGLEYAGQQDALKRGWIDEHGDPLNNHVNSVFYDSMDENVNPHLMNRIDKLDLAAGEKVYSRRRVGNNLSTLLALPGAIAINSGLGLNNPLGGSDGRKAVFASDEDASKTDNVLAEVAAKYILGRQGDLLPWDEFKKVRPDVSKNEYMAYKGYRFNKNPDYNPFDDGEINIANGVFKTNKDGINGPEALFLGKSMPVTTTLIPTAAAIAGTAIGASLARHGTNSISGINNEMERLEIEAERALNKGDTKTKDKYLNKISKLGERQEWMQKSPIFNRLNKTRAIGAGLAGGAAALVGGSVIGNEIERRRREGKVQERQERGY